MHDQHNVTFCLNSDYSTTRLVTREKPVIVNKPEDKFETVLFLPEGEFRTGQGGLRIQGLFKRSLPDKPLITVITVVLNGAKHLEETILSVLNQTYDNVEYIVIDGRSTDGTLDIIRKYEQRIDYWVCEKDDGIYDAMNKGIQLFFGDWIVFLNSGDRILYLDSNSIKNLSRTNTSYYFNEKKMLLLRDPFTKYYLTRNTPCHQSIFYRREDIQYFNTSFSVIADYEQMTRVCKNSLSCCYSDHLIFYSKYGISEKYIADNQKNYLFERINISFKNLNIYYAILSIFHISRLFLKKMIKQITTRTP